jgi:hypothetical protein
MDPSMNIYAIVGLAVVVIFVSVTIFVLFKPKVALQSISVNGPFDLSKSQSIIPMSLDNNGFLKGGAGTFQCFVYMDSLARTGQVNTCGIQPNQPSCASGLYGECPCSNMNDCGNCDHPGYREIVSLYGVYRLEVMNVPDAGRQNAVSTQLIVRTMDTTKAYIETISLPPLPVQKWIMISVTRSGREISIYYDDRIVSSSKLLNLPVETNAGGYISRAGASGLSGTIGLIYLSEEVMATNVIASKYTNITDTRGAPINIESKTTDFSAATQFYQSSPLLSNLFAFPRMSNIDPIPVLGGNGPSTSVSPLYNVQSSYS